jgi:hypothetical protein
MPFLGAETALGCVGGRQVAIFLSLATVAKTGGISGEEIPGDIWVRVLPALGRRLRENRLAVAATITGGFSSKGYTFGTGAARKRLDLA